jgi:uncharacterized membrane protein
MNELRRMQGGKGSPRIGGRPAYICHIAVTVGLLTWLSAFPAAFPASGSTWTGAAERARLEQGEIPVQVRTSDGDHAGWVEAAVLIEAPVEKVWRTMTDCPNAPAFVPGLKACRIVSAGENWEIIRHDVKWVWFLPRLSYEFRAEYEAQRRIQFERIRGALREMRGDWRLFPLTGGRATVVRYSVYLDPGFFIPQLFVQRILKKDLPAVLEALRTEVESRRSRR